MRMKRKEKMSKRKFIAFIGMPILAVAVFAWTPGDALAKRGDKDKNKPKKRSPSTTYLHILER